MNKNIVIGLIVGLVVLGGGGAYLASNSDDSMSSNNSSNAATSSVDMSAVPANLEEEVKNAIERQSMSNVVVLDVRTDEEWNESHATDAFHWGLAEHIDNGELPPLGKNMEIYVYCRSGNRAGQAIKKLQDAGYTNLTNIRGLEDWVAAGGATTSGIDGDDQGGMADDADHSSDSDMMQTSNGMMN